MWFVPGPVPITQKTLAATAGEMMSHRSAPFREIYAECTGALARAFRMRSGYVFSITGSGTMANEAAAANITPNTRTLCLANGEFGERLHKAIRIYNPKAELFEIEDGRGLNAERCSEAIEKANPEWVCFVQNETATGVTNDVQGIASYVKKRGARVLVDAVSSLGGIPLDCDGWGIDACTSASQKSIAAPPGLGFVALSEEAMRHVESQPSIPTYGLNLITYKKFHGRSETPYTPSLPTFYGLRQALREMEAEGIERRWEAHTNAATKARKAVEECGFRLFAEEGFRSDTVTAFLSDKSDAICKAVADQGVHIAGGQGKWKGRMVRIAHIGPEETKHIEMAIEALRRATGKETVMA